MTEPKFELDIGEPGEDGVTQVLVKVDHPDPTVVVFCTRQGIPMMPVPTTQLPDGNHHFTGHKDRQMNIKVITEKAADSLIPRWRYMLGGEG